MILKFLALCLFTFGLIFLNYKAKLTNYEGNSDNWSSKTFYMDVPSPLK